MSLDVHNAGLRPKAHRRSFIVTDKAMRTLSTTMRPAQHEAFDGYARAKNITHTALLRQTIEACIRRPDLFEELLAAKAKL